jgi:acetyl-CoA carboxylase carboxyltransferase component
VEGDQLDAAADGVGEGPWLAAGMGIIDDVIAPAETRERLVHMLEILAPCRSVAPLRETRDGRLVDDIPKL